MMDNKWKRRCICNRGFVMIYVLFVALMLIVVMTTTIQLVTTKRQWHEAWVKQRRAEAVWIRAHQQLTTTCPRRDKVAVGTESFTARYDKEAIIIQRVNSGERRTYTRRSQECDTMKTKRKKVK